MDKAIIGGTGVYGLSNDMERIYVDTDFGTVEVQIGFINGEEIAFLSRHGSGHSVPPHKINYRANMKALEKLGVKYVFATATVGSCRKRIKVGEVVVLKDFIDFTKSRVNTFYHGDTGVVHTDMSDPYCMNLRYLFEKTAEKNNLQTNKNGVYVCTEGPRFETAAEIKMYRNLGGDVVGMTNVPEVVLAKELGMCYAAVGLVSNMCTGISGKSLSEDNMGEAISESKDKVMKCFLEVFSQELSKKACRCSNALMKL